MRTLIWIVLLFFGVVQGMAVADGTSDRSAEVAAIQRVVDRFMVARSTGDADSYAGVFTDTVDYLATRGEMISGKDKVMTSTLENSRTVGGDRSMTFSTLRFIRDDVVLADGVYLIANRLDGGRDSRYYTSWVLVRENGDWKIGAIRNMNPTREDFAPAGPVGPPKVID